MVRQGDHTFLSDNFFLFRSGMYLTLHLSSPSNKYIAWTNCRRNSQLFSLIDLDDSRGRATSEQRARPPLLPSGHRPDVGEQTAV